VARRQLGPGGGEHHGRGVYGEDRPQSIGFLRRINPRSELYVWSDMWIRTKRQREVRHVQWPAYRLLEGLTKDTVLLTWDGGEKALRFFSDLGMRQVIGGYYESMDNVKHWLDQVDAVEAQGATGIDGFMYTTWSDNFGDLRKWRR